MNCFRKILIFLSVFSLLSLVSCGYVKRTQVKSTIDQAHKNLETGDFQKALDIYQSVYKKYPKDTEVFKYYIETIEFVKTRGDKAFGRKDFAAAGRTYRILLENYSSLNHLEQFLSYNGGLLKARIETCQKILFEEGLEQYRSGDLTQAISTWKDILTFDPENLEVRKATDKAIFQSKNLKKIKSDGNR